MTVLVARGHPRLAHVHGQPDGRRQAAGAPAAAADHLSRARTSSTSRCSLALAVALAGFLVFHPGQAGLFPLIILLALSFGVLMIIPIGGADMPTVISLLNSYAGLSAAAMGFVLEQQAADHRRGARRRIGLHPLGEHVEGDEPLVHQRALRRLRPGAGRGGRRRRGGTGRSRARRPRRPPRSCRRPNKVVIVPGYGMAVAQAQHKVRELYDALTEAGRRRQVRHPSRRRPHARPHERPARRGRHPLRPARSTWTRSTATSPRPTSRWSSAPTTSPTPPRATMQSSPIYGMPILDVDKARTVMVIKRSMSPGFAGIDNPLYYLRQDADALRRRPRLRRLDRRRDLRGQRPLSVSSWDPAVGYPVNLISFPFFAFWQNGCYNTGVPSDGW